MTNVPSSTSYTPGFDVAYLRQRLKQFNVWPAAGDEFLALIPLAQWQAPPPSARDKEWLPRVIQDVKNGLDIGTHYPDFFQKLLTNASLRQIFLTELEK